MEYTDEMISNFECEYNSTLDNIKKLVNANVIGKFRPNFYPPQQWIRIDALHKKDWPSNIKDNSVYIDFMISFDTRKVEVVHSGHVYLSPKDLMSPKYKYLAMKSIINVAVDKGLKKFRKSKFKDANDLAKKISSYYNKVMECVTEYTGGYPYKQGIER